MRNIIIFSFIFCFQISLSAQSDSSKCYLTAGAGYFSDLLQYIDPGYGDVPSWGASNPKTEGKIFHGMSVWFDAGYNLKTGYAASLFVSMAKTYSYQNDPLGLWWDRRQVSNFLLTALTFKKDLRLGKRQQITPGVGLLYRHFNETRVIYNVQEQDGEIYMSFPELVDYKEGAIGLWLTLDYSYRLTNQCAIGLNLSGDVLIDYGLESIAISPFIKVYF